MSGVAALIVLAQTATGRDVPSDVIAESTVRAKIVLSPDAYVAVAALADGSKVSFTAHTQEITSHTWNAVARLSGSDGREKGDIILLTAHLDIDFGHMTESIQSLLAPIRWLADSNFKPEWLPGGRPE